MSGGARFFAGAWAGNSFIDLDLHLMDEATGERVGLANISVKSDAMAGAWSVGSTDRNLIEYAVDVAHAYFARSNPEASTPPTASSANEDG